MRNPGIYPWLGAGRSHLRHIGLDSARSLHFLFRGKKLKGLWILISVILLQLASLAFYFGLSYHRKFDFLADKAEFLRSAAIVSSALFIVIFLPLLSLQSLLKNLSKNSILDLLVVLGLLAYGLEKFFTKELGPGMAVMIQSLGFFYFLLRLMEAYWHFALWKPDVVWPLAENFFSELRREERKLYLRNLAVGLFLVGLSFLYFFYKTDWSKTWPIPLILSYPFVLPLSTWAFSRLAQSFSEYGIQVGSFKSLFQIKNINFLRFHCFGVLTKARHEDPEFFFDPSSAWEDNYVKELLSKLVQSSIHPLSRAISEELGSNEKESWDVENIPYAGLKSKFRTSDGKLHELVLSSYHWMATHKHEFGSAILQARQDWAERSRLDCYVSIDSRVVAGVSVSSQLKEDTEMGLKQLREQGFQMGLWSSSGQHSLPILSRLFDECVSELLPLERELKHFYWSERAPQYMSILSSWDPDETGWKVVFGANSSSKPETQEIQVLSDKFSSLNRLFDESRRFRALHWMSLSLPLSIFFAVLALSFFLPPMSLLLFVFAFHLLLVGILRRRFAKEIVLTGTQLS